MNLLPIKTPPGDCSINVMPAEKIKEGGESRLLFTCSIFEVRQRVTGRLNTDQRVFIMTLGGSKKVGVITWE